MPEKDKNLYDTLSNNTTFDDTLKQDTINSALGKDSVDTQPQGPVSNTDILRSNINSTQVQNDNDIFLDDNELSARDAGFQDFELGVNHFSQDEINAARLNPKMAPGRGITTDMSGSASQEGSPNVTAELAEDYVADEEANISSGRVYREILGDTAFADLKAVCGLSRDESFTDFYNRTHYVPKGYELDVKLALAEEKRMNEYMRYQNKEISYNKFLYNAYGKDLLIEQGYDFSSKLFWYNKFKNNDYTNPLESTSFLSDLLKNAESLFKADSWYRDSSAKELTASMANLATGTMLSEEEFKKVFSTQVENLSPYFDNDVKKIMNYYRAGYLSSAFSPFIDVNGDGKFDYYYHNDGKLYAVDNEDSVGTGKATATLVYNDDGSVHSAQVHEGVDGWADSLWDGFSQFFAGIADIGALAVNGVSAIFGVSFADKQTEWEAWKKEWLMDEDRIVFDSMSQWNGEDWGNAVAEASGYIAGMVALILLTWGVGAAVSGASAGTEAGIQAGQEGLKLVGEKATQETVKAGIAKGVESLNAKLIGKELTQKQFNRAMNSMMRTFIKEGAKQGVTKALLNAGGTAAAQGIGAGMAGKLGSVAASKMASRGATQIALNNIANVLVGQGITKTGVDATGKMVTRKVGESVLTSVGKARGGTAISSFLSLTAKEGTKWAAVTSNVWFRSGVNAAELAMRDVMQMTAQLQAQNRTLAYMQDNVKDENGNPVYNKLSDTDIFLRVAAVAGTDMLISTLFRATGDQGFSSKIVDTSNINRALDKASDGFKNRLNGYLKHMRTWAVADSVLDIFENVTTSATQAMMSNPYAQDAESLGRTYLQSIINPKSIAMNLYALSNDLFTYGHHRDGSSFNTSIYDDRMNALLSSIKTNGNKLGDLIADIDIAFAKSNKYTNTDIHESLVRFKSQIEQDIQSNKGNVIENLYNASQKVGELFSDDVISSNEKEIIEGYGISKQEFENIKKFIKEYNSTATKDEDKINFVTGKILFDAKKANDKYVAEVYGMILNHASEVSTSRLKAYNSWMSKGGLTTKLFAKGGTAYATSIKKLMTGIGNKVVTEFDLPLQDLTKTFVQNRFESLEEPFNIDGTPEEYNEYREKARGKLRELLEKDYIQTGSFSENNLNANVKYTWEYDEKTDSWKYTGEATEVPDILTKLFTNPNKNRGAIDALINAGIFTEEDGKLTASGGAPLWYFTIPSDKHNDFLKASSDDPDVANFFRTLDLMALAGQDGVFDSYNIPMLVKIKVAVGNSSDNPNATQDVYVICNNFGSGLTESANRLQALQATLYTVYRLYLNAEATDAKYKLSQEELQKYMAQLGTLLCEESTQDPYYDFLKEWNEKKAEGFEAQIKLATAYALRGASMTDDNVLFNRSRLLELYRAGAISRSTLKELESHNLVGKQAKLLGDYIDYAVVEDNRIKTALGALVALADDPDNGEKKNIVINLIKDLNAAENKELLEILRKDGKISGSLDELIKQQVTDPEAFSNFWNELQSTTHLGARTRLVSGLKDAELIKIRDSLLENFLKPETVKIISERTKRSSIVKEVLNRTFVNNLDEPINKLMKGVFGKTPIDRIGFFNAMTDEDIKEFLTDPIAKIDKYVTTYKYPDGNGLSQKRIDLMNAISKKIKDQFLSDEGTFLYEKLFNEVMDYMTDGSGLVSSNRDAIANLVGIALGKDFNATSLRYNSKLECWTYNSKPVGKLVLTSPLTKNLIGKSLLPEARETAKQIISNSLDLYYKDTTSADSLNIVTLNILDILPDNLYRGLKALATSKALSKSADLSARIKGEDINDIFNNLLKTNGYTTMSQYNAYYKMLDLALKTNNFIFTYDLNNEDQMNSLRAFLTSIGYDNALRDLEDESVAIPGLYFKKIKTHNLNSTINYTKLYNYALSKAVNNNHTTDIEVAKKDMIPVLFNMFDSLNYVKGTDKVKLIESTSPEDYKVRVRRPRDADGNNYFSVSVDRTGAKKAIVFGDLIFKKVGDNFEITKTITDEELDRAIKGTLEGGSNLEKYIIRNRFLDVKHTDENIDIKSSNTDFVLKTINKVWDYLYKFKGNEETSFTISVPDDKVSEFEAMYSDPNSMYTYRKERNGVYVLIAKPDLNKDEFIKNALKNGFNLKQILPIWNPLDIENVKVVDAQEFSQASNETLFSVLYAMQHPLLRTSEDFKRQLSIIYESKGLYQLDDDKYRDFCIKHNNESYDQLLKALESEDTENNYYFALLKYKLEKDIAISEFAKDGLSNSELALLDIANDDMYNKLGLYLNKHNLTSKNYEPTDEDIRLLSKENGISEEAARVLVDTLRHTQDMLLRSISDKNVLGKQDLLLSALSQFMHEGEAGSSTFEVEFIAGATRKTQLEFLKFLDDASKDSEAFDDNERKALSDLYSLIDDKLQILYGLDPSYDDDKSFANNLEVLYALAGKNSPSVKVMIDKNFLYKSLTQIDQDTLDLILEAGISRDLKRKQGSPFVKLSSQNLSNISTSDDYFTYSLGQIINATVLRGIADKPGSIMIENMQRRDVVGRYMLSVMSNIVDLEDGLFNNGIKMDKKLQRNMLADLAIQMHTLTTGQDYQADYATSAILHFNDQTGDYEIVPLALSIQDEDNSIISYLLGRKTIGSDFELKDFSLNAISNLISKNPHEHVFLFKGSKNMFVDSLEGVNSRSAFISLDNDETREKIRDYAFTKWVKDVDSGNVTIDGNSYDETEIYNMLKNGADFNEYIADYYNLKYTLPLQDLWYDFIKSYENIGVAKEILPSIFNSVQSMYAGRAIKTGDQLIDDVIERSSESLKDNLDEYQYNIIMDTLKYGINHAALSSEDELNFKNYALRVKSEMQEETVGLDYGIIDRIIKNDVTKLESVKDGISRLSEDEKVYCVKQILLNRFNGSDIFSVLNARDGKTLSDVLKSLSKNTVRGINRDMVTDWVSRDKKHNLFNVTKNTVNATFDLEWLTKDNDPSFRDGLYQIAFAIRDPSNGGEVKKFNFLVKSRLNSKDAIQQDAETNNKEALRFTESVESFTKKAKLPLDDYSKWDDDELIKHSQVVVKDPTEALSLAYRVLKKFNVETLLGFNSFNDSDDDVSDIKFFIDAGYDLRQEMNLVDIMSDALNKIYTHETEGLIGRRMDDIREQTNILDTKVGDAHDASVDIDDEYKLFDFLINNATRTDKLYTNDLDKLSELFGKDIFDKVNFDGIKLSKNLESIFKTIDIKKNTFVRGNQSFKRILDDYNAINFNHTFKRINNKALNRTLENTTDIYFGTYNKAYNSVLKNFKARKNITNILMGLMNYNAEGKDIYSIIGKNDYSAPNNKLIANALRRTGSILNEALQVYSIKARKSIDPELQMASRDNLNKLFYAQKDSAIKDQLAKALFIIDKNNELRLDNKKTISRYDALKLYDLSSDIKKKYENIVNNMFIRKGDEIDTKGFFESLRTNPEIKYDDLAADESKTNFVNKTMNPIARMLGIQMSDDVAKSYSSIGVDSVLSNVLSSETRKRLLHSLMQLKGTTKYNKENNITRAKELSTYNGRRIKFRNWIDKYEKDMSNEIFGKDGMLGKHLVEASSLWSMGSGRRSFRSDGEEDTLYLGIDLLTSKKAYASLYGKYKVGDTFYANTWRQPLQQTTPLNVMKVVVVPGVEYSMTASTARKLHNGDFDGDYFFTQLIPDDNKSVAEKIWTAQHIGGGLLSNIFEKDFDYSKVNNRTQDDANAAKAAFNSLTKEFKSLLNGDYTGFESYEKAYENFENKFIQKFLTVYFENSNKNFTNKSRKEQVDSALRMLSAFGINEIDLHGEKILTTSNPFFDDLEIKKIINERNTYFMSSNQFDTGLAAPENGEAAKHYKGYKMTVPENELYKLFYVPTPALDADVMSDLESLLKAGHKLSSAKMNKYVETLHNQKMINDDTFNFAQAFISEMVNAKPEVASKYVQVLMQTLQRDMQQSSWYQNTLKEIVPEMLGKLDAETYKKYKVVYKFMRDEFGEAIDLPELKEGSTGLDILKAVTDMAHKFFNDRQAKDYIRFASSDDPFAYSIYADAAFRNKQFGFNDIRDDTEVISADELVELNAAEKKAFGLSDCWVAVDNFDEGALDTMQIVNRGKNGLSYTNVNQVDLNSLTTSERKALAKYISKIKSGGFIKDKHIISDMFDLDNDDETKYQLVGVVNRFNNEVAVNENTDLSDCTLLFTDSISLYNLAKKENVKLGFANAKAGKGSTLLYEGSFDDNSSIDLVMSKKLFNIEKIGNNLIESRQSKDGRYTYYHVRNLAVLNNLNFEAQNRDSSRYIDQIGIVQGAHGLGSLLAFSNLFIKINEDGSYTFDPTLYSDLQKALSYDNLERSYQDTNSASLIRTTRIAYLLSAIKDESRLQEVISKFSYGKCKNIDSFVQYIMNDQSLGGSRGAIIESGIWKTLTRDEQNKIDDVISSKNNSFGKVAFSREADDAMVNPYVSYFTFRNNPIVSKHGKPNDETVRTSKMRGESDNEDFLAQLEHSGHDLNEGNFISTEAVVKMLLEQQGRKYSRSTTRNAYEDEVLNPVYGKLGNLYNGFHFMSDDQSLDLDPSSYEETQSAKKAGNKRLYSERLRNLEQYSLFNIVPEESKYIRDDVYNETDNVFDNLNEGTNEGNIAKALKSALPFFGDGSDVQTAESYNMFNFGYNANLHKRYAAIDDDDQGTSLKVKTIRPEYELDQFGEVKKVDGIPQFKNYSFEEYKQFISDNSRNPQEVEILLNKKALFKKDFININQKDAMNVLNIRIKEKAKASAEIQNIISSWKGLNDEYESYESITPEFDMNKVDLIFKTEKKYDENNVLNVARIYSDDNSIKLVNSILNSYGYKATANGEIALGAKTLNFQSNIGHNKEDLLGSEYNYILTLARVLPETYIQLNKYMEIEAALEANAELTYKNQATNIDNEKKYIKLLGKEKYSEYVEATKSVFKDSTPEELRQMQLEMLKDNEALRSMVQAAAKINRRLVLETSKVDPTGLIGWVLTTNMENDDNGSWFKYRNMKLQKLYKNNFVESIHSIGKTIQSMSDPESASLFFNNKTGYIGMIEDLSTRIATTQASDKLGDYLRSNGWMKNLDVINIAMNIFQEKIASYYNEAINDFEDKNTKTYLENKKLFDSWLYVLNDAGVDVYNKLSDEDIEYRNVGSLYNIFNLVSGEYNMLLSNLKVTGMQEARDKVYQLNISSELPEDKNKCDQMLKLLNAYENIFAEIIRTASVNGKTRDIYSSINNAILSEAKRLGKVLVDKHGRHINKGDETLDYSSNHFYFDLVTMLKTPDNPDEIPMYQAKEALLGNVYLMDPSVAQQLERKVYSQRMHSKVKTYMRKAKNLATALIMSSPVQLLDRLVSFPMFDAGVVGSASASTYKFMPEAMSTVMKYINGLDYIDEKTLSQDPTMKKLLRFLASSNQNIFDNTVRGEQMKVTIPLIKQYTQAANLGFNAGNLIPRFAYYLNLLDSAEANELNIDRSKTGVVWDKYDQLNKIEADDNLVKSGLYDEFGDDAKEYADIDSRIAYIISQHNGLEGNMPYGAQWLNENYNTMFLSFPMALVRWGRNRITSVGNALADAFNGNSNRGLQYLAGQLGSVMLTQAILLGLQMLISKDTRDYIGKKIAKKDEELTEEEIKNAETILFRGGVVKPFQSLLQGEEVTSPHLSRGPASALFDSYVADFTNKFGDSDKSIGEKIKNFIMQHTWAHTNFLPKDMIESIPGNNFLQSTSWYTDSGNWFENYGRKVLGYSLGSAQASNFMEYMKANHEKDDGLFKNSKKLANAMEYAYSEKYSNTKETKSEARNYKKAIQIIADYYSTVYGNNNSGTSKTTTDDEFVKKLKNAMETGSSAHEVYSIIEDSIRKGKKSYNDVQKALRKISIREKIVTLPDYTKFIDSLSDSDYAVIKTALAYEDHHYPYLDDLLTEINSKATREYYQANAYTKSVSSILRTMSYNTPKSYNRYNKYNYRKNYKNNKLYFNQYRKQYKNEINPMEAYNASRDVQNYGTSKDVWGNETRHYTDGTTYSVRQPGMPFPGGNK